MLEVKNVTKRYGKNVACDDVSFTLEPGTLTVLLGPNGAGKSTIIKSIIGFLKFDGTITVNGIPNKTSEARKLLGYIPEMPSLYPTLTVIEHMEFIARAYKMTDYKDRVNMLLERFELDDKRKKFGDELSKGMQQKLNLCLGLLPDPDIILLDEPLLGLDPHAIKELKNYIEEMRRAGKTLFISTHIIEEAASLFEKVIIIDDGQIMIEENTEELLARAYRVSGEETNVDAAVRNFKTYHPESIGRNKVVTVLADEPVDGFDGDVQVEPVPLQNLFYAMCVDGRKEA